MVSTRLIDPFEYTVRDSPDSTNGTFEPGKILELLPPILLEKDLGLIILISDGNATVEYTLNTFISKSYKIKNGKIRFGSKLLDEQFLSITFGVKFQVEPYLHLVDNSID